MSSTRCQAINWFLYPLAGAILLCLNVEYVAEHELELLRCLTVFFVLAHIHYGVCITRQLCEHFKINCFTIKHQYEKVENNKREK